MIRRAYIGLARPATHFDELRPARAKLAGMGGQFHPATDEYRALMAADFALRAVADLITGQDDFFRVRGTDFARLGKGERAGSKAAGGPISDEEI